ncbi:MAG: hypothetical protein IJC48_07040 [Clostridia bacterium]|nr:hypothetical protein [Clostridia bacterium]MBQ4157870.1 hypothetical protein [Clostridia bacterium]
MSLSLKDRINFERLKIYAPLVGAVAGAIEQDADVVMFIHREDYYEPTPENKGIAEIIIAKQRNGALGTCNLGWKGEYTWFMDLDPEGKEVQRPS